MGGSYFSSAQLARYLSEESDYSVVCAVLKGAENKAVFDRDRLCTLEHRIHIRNLRNVSRFSVFLYRLYPDLLRVLRAVIFIRRVKPGIVHLHDDHSFMIWAKAADMCGVPVIWHVRQEKRKPADAIRVSLCSKIICISQGCAWRFSEDKGAQAKLDVIYNGIDLDEFRPPAPEMKARIRKELGIFDDAIVLGFVGNLVERKRPEWACHALGKLHELGISAHLFFVGEDRERPMYSEVFSDRDDWARLSRYCHFLGLRNDVSELISAFDITLVPSERHGEPFSRVVAESCAMGVPVVACRGVGALELLENGRNCIFCDNDDLDDFVDAVVELAQNSSVREEIGKTAAETAQKVFSYRRMGLETMAVYNEILSLNRNESDQES